jgi:hypothetical protein
VGGGVRGRAGVEVPNGNAGFDASRAGAGAPNEKVPALDAGLDSDCAVDELNKSPVGALAGGAVEGPNVNPVDATADFSAVEGVVEEAPNVNMLLAGAEGSSGAVSLVGRSKVMGADDVGGLDASAGSADPDTDVDINLGLGASEKPGFKGSTLSAGAGVATRGKEKGVDVPPVG